MPEICLSTKAWRSGSAWVAQMIAQAIAEQGATIAFVAPAAEPVSREPHHPNLTRIRTPRELVGAHFRLRRMVASLARISAGLFQVSRLRLSTQSFIFSIPEPLIFTLPLFGLLRLSRARVILIVHDARPHAWALSRWLRPLERGSHALSYRLASTLVVLTPPAREALIRDFGVAAGKVVVIPHGPLSVGDVEPMPGSGRLLIFGSLRRNKSVLEVIDAVVRIRRTGLDVQLVLAGEPLSEEAGYWGQCLAAVAADPGGFDIRVGFLPDSELPGLIATVDAFVLAYRNFDSQSGVGVLAALSGRPVIGTRSGGLAELFEHGMTGEILPDQPTVADIAGAITAFYGRSVAHWRSAAADGVSRMANAAGWDQIADQYIEIATRSSASGETTAGR